MHVFLFSIEKNSEKSITKMTEDLSPKDVFKALFPSIEVTIVDILVKFSMEFDNFAKKKGEKIAPSDKLNELFMVFPRKFNRYTVCVDSFVDFGSHSPSAAINFLLNILPRQPNNFLFQNIVKKISFYDRYSQIIDLFFHLFFADCVVQLYTCKMSYEDPDILLDICYNVVPTQYEPYEEVFLIKVLKQYSVLLGFLSITQLPKILDNFNKGVNKYDHTMFMILHRFTRLTTSDKVDLEQIGSFLSAFISISKTIKKSHQFEVWSDVLCSICSQLKGDFVDAIEKPVTQIFNIALDKAHDQHAGDSHIILAGTILQRFSNLKKKHYNDYLNKSILEKATKPHKTLGCLKGFLTIIRGAFVSKKSSFWEWGKFNAQINSGVEATQIADPHQDQADPNSYTSLFFKYFIPVPKIEQYYQILGEILLNFAARDFSYFTKETAPLLITSMSNDRCLLPLSECLVRIVNKDLHFEEWAQLNPRNQRVNVSILIPNLFTMIKDFLFRVTSLTLKRSSPSSVFSFSLSHQVEALDFILPLHFEAESRAMDERIKKANAFMHTTGERLHHKHELKIFEPSDVEKTTQEEDTYIKLLSFLPRIINTADLYSIGKTIIWATASKSRAVSHYAILVLNNLYVSAPENRVAICGIILDCIDHSGDPLELIMYLQLLAKLLDLSMRPNCKDENISKFVNHAMATCIICLAYRPAPLRDLTMNLIERVNRFAKSMGVPMPLKDIVCDEKITREALKCNDQSMSPRFLASTEYWESFTRLIPVIVLKFAGQASEESVCFLFRNIDKKIEDLGEEALTDNNLGFVFHTIIMTCLPATSEGACDALQKYIFQVKFDSKVSLMKNYQPLMKKLEKYMTLLAEHKVKKNSIIENVFSIMSWQTASKVFDMIDTFKISADPDFMYSYSKICANILATKNISYGLLISENTHFSFDRMVIVFKEYFVSSGVNNEGLNPDPSAFEAKFTDKLLATAVNFMKIIALFAQAFIHPIKSYAGPIMLPRLPDFIYNEQFAHSCTSLAMMCFNWTSTKSDELNNSASEAIASLASITPIFNQHFPISPRVISILFLSAHSGKDTLKRCLFFHYKILIKEYIKAVYERQQEVSRVYFLAICSFFCGDAPKDERRAQMVQRMLSPFEKPDPRYPTTLSAAEKVLQCDIIETAGNVIVCAMLNILNLKEDMKMSAFKLITRLIPLLLTLHNEAESESQKTMIKELSLYADAIYTNSATLSPKHIIKIAKMICDLVPYISESVLEECINAARCGRNISQNVAFDIMTVFLKYINLQDGGYVKDKSHKLTIFTPLSLAKTLIDIYPNVTHSALSSYLNAWKKLSVELELIVSFLLDIADESKLVGVKTILVYLAKICTSEVIEMLVGRLTFANWFYTNAQGKLEGDLPPDFVQSKSIRTVLAALCEICQNSVESIFQNMYIIINFSILFSDTYPQILELLYVIFTGLNDSGPILELILDPSKIASPEHFTEILVKYFQSQKAKSVVHKWGAECVKWATGCGNFEIASKAAAVFSKILSPVDVDMLQIMLKSLYNVVICQQNESSNKYVTNIFVVMNKLVDKMNNSPNFDELFTYLMKLARQFMCVPDSNVAIESTRIVAKYVQSTKCKHDGLLEMLPMVCINMARMEDRKSIDGLIMSLMVTPKTSGRHHRPHIQKVAFCLFLPRLASAIAAFHNKEPFIVYADDEVKYLLEIGLSLAKLPLFNEDISQSLYECLSKPAEHTLEEFAFRVIKPMIYEEAITVVGPLYTALCEKCDEVLKCAIFYTVSSMLRGSNVRDDATPFLDMMPVAATHTLSSLNASFSSSLLEIFVQLSVLHSSPKPKSKPNKVQLKDVAWVRPMELSFLTEVSMPQSQAGDNFLQRPLTITPFDKQFWNVPEIVTLRKELAKIVVQPFTSQQQNLEKKKAEVPDFAKASEVPSRVEDFVILSKVKEHDDSSDYYYSYYDDSEQK